MAENSEELKKEFEQLRKEYQSLFRGDQVPFKEMSKEPSEANRQIKFFKDGIAASKREAAGLSGIFNDLNKQLRANLSELDKSNNAVNLGKKAYRELSNVVRDLADEEAGIGKVSFANLKKLESRNKSNLVSLKAAAQQLLVEKGITNESQLRNASSDLITDNERALLAASFQNFKLEERAGEAVTRRLELERNVLDTVKLTGGALNGIGNLARSLGLSGFAESIEEIKSSLDDKLRKKIRDAAIEKFDTDSSGKYSATLKKISEEKERIGNLQAQIAEQDGEATETQKKLLKAAEGRLENVQDELAEHEKGIQALYKKVTVVSTLGEKFTALGKAAGEFVKQLSDPLVILGAMAKGFFAVDEAATQLQRTTGQNAIQIAGQNTALATSAEVLELMSTFADQTGRNLADLVPPQELGKLRAIADLMGLTAEEAGTLALNTQLSGTNVSDFKTAAFEGAKEIAVSTGSAINLGTAVQEAAKASGGLALNLGNNPAALARAAAAAQRLGLNLQQMEGIAEGMLDFESSIQHELEAQLLTGKNINLAKAREFALRGDMEGLAKEIGKQEGVMEAFASKNLIAQQAAAKAVGMTRGELAKAIALRAIEEGQTLEAAARMSDMTEDQILQLDTQQKMNKAVGKLQQSLAPLIEALTPLVDILAASAQILGQMFSMFSSIGMVTSDINDDMSQMNAGLDGANETMEELSTVTKILGGTIVGGILLGGLRKVYKIATGLGSTVMNIIKSLKGAKNIGKEVIEEVAEKGAKEVGKKVTTKGATKGASKLLGKSLGKTVLKKIPGIGLLAGIGFGIQRAIEGDILGASAEVASGLASTLPGIGTAASLAIDAGLVARDLSNQSKIEELESPNGGSAKLNDFTIRSNPADTLLMAGGTKFGEETNALLRQLIAEVSNIQGDVYIDGYKAGQSIFAASNNLPS